MHAHERGQPPPTHAAARAWLPQAQQRRLHEMSNEMEAMQAEVASKDAALAAARARAHEAERRMCEMQQQQEQELENTQHVFQLHYTELLAKNEEIARLQAMIRAGAGGRAAQSPQQQPQPQDQQFQHHQPQD